MSGGKSDDISWRQGLVFIHNIIELKGMQKILVSHWKALWVTRKGSRTFLKPCMTPCECRQLTGVYSWPQARNQVATRMRWECVPNKVFPDSESELKLSEATVPGGSVASLWLKVFCSNK